MPRLVALLAALLASPALAQETGETLAIPAPPVDAALPDVEPIIGDEEFEAAVPELDPLDDPELSGELESIEQFERRLADEESAADQEAPLGDPALADGDRSEEVADATIRDAELVKPLPPVESFEVTPVEFAQPTAADDESVTVAYQTVITGLDEANEQTPTGLRSLFRSFSALREGGGKAANVAMVQARL